jgi:hypothetical protein
MAVVCIIGGGRRRGGARGQVEQQLLEVEGKPPEQVARQRREFSGSR